MKTTHEFVKKNDKNKNAILEGEGVEKGGARKGEGVGGVFGNDEILKAYKDGRIIIDPFNKSQIQLSSVDVTLGPFYYRQSKILSNNTVLESTYMWSDNFCYPKNCIETINYFNESKKSVLSEYSKINIFACFKLDHVLPTDTVIIINPGESILAHTYEFIGSNHNTITTMCKAKSTMGRFLIEVCKCAGWGDPGYFNRWTLEITNNSTDILLLKVGMPIAQIVFFNVINCHTNSSYHTNGRYQTTNNLEDLKKNWSPTSMLPKIKC